MLRALFTCALLACSACATPEGDPWLLNIGQGQSFGANALTGEGAYDAQGGEGSAIGDGWDGEEACSRPASPCTGTTYAYLRADDMDGSCNSSLSDTTAPASWYNPGTWGNPTCTTCPDLVNSQTPITGNGKTGSYVNFVAASSEEYSLNHNESDDVYTYGYIAGPGPSSGSTNNAIYGGTSNGRAATSYRRPDANAGHLRFNAGLTVTAATTMAKSTNHAVASFYTNGPSGTYDWEGVAQFSGLDFGGDPTEDLYIGSYNGGGSLFWEGRIYMLLVCDGDQESEIIDFFKSDYGSSWPDAW